MEDLTSRIWHIYNIIGSKSRSEFAKKIGVTNSNFIQMMKGNRPIGDNIIRSICYHLNVNEVWLRTGEGETFKDVETKTENQTLSELINVIKISNSKIDELSKEVKDVKAELKKLKESKTYGMVAEGQKECKPLKKKKKSE